MSYYAIVYDLLFCEARFTLFALTACDCNRCDNSDDIINALNTAQASEPEPKLHMVVFLH